jgi:hypothetical protein
MLHTNCSIRSVVSAMACSSSASRALFAACRARHARSKRRRSSLSLFQRLKPAQFPLFFEPRNALSVPSAWHPLNTDFARSFKGCEGP